MTAEIRCVPFHFSPLRVQEAHVSMLVLMYFDTLH